MTTRIFALLVACAFGLQALAASRITATVTLTNVPTAGATLVVNSDTRTWATNVTSPATQLLIGATIQASTTNLWSGITVSTFGELTPSFDATNRIALAGRSGAALSVAGAGWASVTYSTQDVANLQTVRVPMSGEPNAVRTNSATLLATGIGAYSLAPIPQTSAAAGELVGLTNAQTISGDKTFTGAAVFAVIETTNLVNHGDAISSRGSAAYSEQFGSTSLANGVRSVAFGYSAVADGDNSLAIGYASHASDTGGVALRGSAYGVNAVALGGAANGVSSTAVANSTADGDYSAAIGDTAYASGDYSMAIGYGVSVSTDHLIVIGTGAETLQAPGTLLGSGTTYLASLNGTIGTVTNGVLIAPRLTNSVVHASSLQGTITTLAGGWLNGTGASNLVTTNITTTGTLSLGGIVQFPQSGTTSLANGNNAAVSPGSGCYLKILPGPTGAFTINGISGGATGRLLYVQNGTGQTMTIANDSGVDPTAANRIYTGRAADLAVTNGNFVVTLIYDAHSSRWVVVSP